MTPEELKDLLLRSHEELMTVRSAIDNELRRRDESLGERRRWLCVAGPSTAPYHDYRRWDHLRPEEQAEVREEYKHHYIFDGPAGDFARTALAWKRKEPRS